jgi:hypothetical protein
MIERGIVAEQTGVPEVQFAPLISWCKLIGLVLPPEKLKYILLLVLE